MTQDRFTRLARCVRAWAKSPASRRLAERLRIDTERGWSSGGCDVFAHALKRLIGRPGRFVAELDTDGDPVHVMVEVPGGRYIDARGMTTAEEIRRDGWPLPIPVTRKVEDQIAAWSMALPENVDAAYRALRAACGPPRRRKL